MTENADLNKVISYISLKSEVNKRKRDLEKAMQNGVPEDIERKRKIYEATKKARDSYVGK